MSAEAVSPRWSILLPTHNRADVIGFAIYSVLAQTDGEFEVLIVGDGCTDNTAAVVASFQDARLRWFDLPKANGFGYANRNIALKEARGEFIAFMAHDDLWLPDHLELMAGLFNQPETEIAYSRPLWVAPDGLILPAAFHLSDPATRKAFLDHKENRIPAVCVVHQRDCLEKYGYWDESILRGGDWDMWLRIIQGAADNGHNQNPAYLPEPTTLHFRAIWKTDANSGYPQSQIWQDMEASSPLLPPALHPHVPPHQTEQEAFWNLISPNPARWTEELRSAIHQLLDARLWRSDDQLTKILSSHEWKLAQKVGRLRGRFAPPDSQPHRLLSYLRRRWQR